MERLSILAMAAINAQSYQNNSNKKVKNMPYQNDKPSKSDVNYFLSRYDGFKKEAETLIQKYSKPGFNYKWVIEHSSFSDPGPDYNQLILICSSDKFGEEKRISCFEKGY